LDNKRACYKGELWLHSLKKNKNRHTRIEADEPMSLVYCNVLCRELANRG